MREIIFHGKRLDNGEWTYGSLLTYADGSCFICCEIYPGKLNKLQVDPATVGQYTGLKNQSGQKIFEGDICDFTVFDYNDYDTQYRGVVVYDGSRFMLWKSTDSEYYGSDGGFDLDWVLAQDDEFEIAGNLWDSPELLREGENNA